MELNETLKAFVKEQFNVETVDDNTPLISSGMIDSMQVLEIAMFVETQTGQQLREDDMIIENFDSIQAIEKLVQKY